MIKLMHIFSKIFTLHHYTYSHNISGNLHPCFFVLLQKETTHKYWLYATLTTCLQYEISISEKTFSLIKVSLNTYVLFTLLSRNRKINAIIHFYSELCYMYHNLYLPMASLYQIGISKDTLAHQ